MKTALCVMLLVLASVAFAEANPSLSTVLSPDGRIMEGVSGSFDPTGFCMEYGPDGEPLFMEEGSSLLGPVHSPAGQDLDGTWYPLGSGIGSGYPDGVNAIDVNGSDVYVGGRFTLAGGNPANQIARWDGSSWFPLGGGVGGKYPWVYAIAVSGSDVYVGGQFTKAGGNPDIRFIARWDGSSWSALGSGVSAPVVWAITVSGSDLYVGGLFSQAGGNPAYNIARWDGSSWHPLGGGVNASVRALAVSGSDVYVGGSFHEAGGNPAHCIVRWDSSFSSWYPMGQGVAGNDPKINAIAVSGSDVYVGGYFTQAGSNPANHVARWDGSSWHSLGGGVEGSYPKVYAIAVSGSDVYVGGEFTLAGGNPANNIARWDGSSWSALGSGVNYIVRAIAVSGSDLYVGGDFTLAGYSPANRIARWVPGPTGIEPPIEGLAQVLHASPNPMTVATSLMFQSTGVSPLTLSIYDTAGRLVRSQDLGSLPVGSHTHYWNGRDGNDTALTSGVYFVRLSSEEFQASTRVVLVR